MMMGELTTDGHRRLALPLILGKSERQGASRRCVRADDSSTRQNRDSPLISSLGSAAVHLAVLASPESWYLADLRRAAAGRHEVTALAFRDLQSEIGAQAGGREVQVSAGGSDLRRIDALLVRTMPPGSLEQVVFRMDLLGRLETAGVPVFNPPRAIEAAVDKYLASARLAAAGLLVPRTIVCQTADDAMAAFAALGSERIPLQSGMIVQDGTTLEEHYDESEQEPMTGNKEAQFEAIYALALSSQSISVASGFAIVLDRE